MGDLDLLQNFIATVEGAKTGGRRLEISGMEIERVVRLMRDQIFRLEYKIGDLKTSCMVCDSHQYTPRVQNCLNCNVLPSRYHGGTHGYFSNKDQPKETSKAMARPEIQRLQTLVEQLQQAIQTLLLSFT